jgi:hypothetical protein
MYFLNKRSRQFRNWFVAYMNWENVQVSRLKLKEIEKHFMTLLTHTFKNVLELNSLSNPITLQGTKRW